jgi:DNA-binding MarR family transcriptional regulator
MLTDKSNITRLIKGVEVEGFVYRTQHPTDGRAQSLYLTEVGEGLLQEAEAAHRAFTEQRFSAFSRASSKLLHELAVVKQHLESQLDR